MDCVLTCILVLVVCLQQAVVNLHRNSNNLITDFINLPNRMFLFRNVVFESYSVCFANIRGSPDLKWAPCGPSFQLWYACCRQTNYVQNIRGLNTLLFLEVSRLVIQDENLYFSPYEGCFQKLSSITSREPLCFGHRFHSSCHGLIDRT